jgi:hypothetical protein
MEYIAVRESRERTVGASKREELNVDDFKGHFEGVGRLYQQIDEKISEKGGLMNLFGLHSKLRESLEVITAGELDALLSEIHRSREVLNRLQNEVLELRFLKEVISSAASRPAAANNHKA